MRIWLDRIGVKRKYRPEGWNRPLKRTLKCLFEKNIYGVDSRETYDLDNTWRMWLYEHLKMFRRKAEPVIDMTEKQYDFNGKKYNQLELIDMMLERLKFALDPKSGYDDYNPEHFN